MDDPEAGIQIATFSCGGRESRQRPVCPLYVMSVERSGAVHFRGTAFVRVEEAKTKLSDDETRALFALVTDGVWGPPVEGSALSHRDAPPVRFSFRFTGGPRDIGGDPRCSQDGSNVDRFTLPTTLCNLEHALKKVAEPFTDCDGKRCPQTPDPRAKPKPMPPPIPPGMGALEVSCARCTKMTFVPQDASAPRKKLGKSPARVDVPPGRYSVVLTYGGAMVVHYPTVRAGETARVESSR